MSHDLQGHDGQMDAIANAELGDYFSDAGSGSSARPRTATRLRPSTLFRYRVVKRTFDVVCVLVATPVLIPALLLVCLLVRLSSSGPILFGSRRVGFEASFFSMWKFRTMWVESAEALDRYLASDPGARAEWARSAKLKEDPRVTPLGLILRRYSLDELPQVWHVLTGQMSLVGPRPLPPGEVERYADRFEDFCCVKPGLTGLWQVSGRSNLTYEERVALDCKYIQTWSLKQDLIILFKTLKPVLNRDGAY
jgi:lipopolysaccharide/colanic/teichoic acid biosynthesis glycosyltransferase